MNHKYCWHLQTLYRTRAIISRGLYIFYPISKDHFFVFKEVFSENSVFMYGLYSRAAYDGARTVDWLLEVCRWDKNENTSDILQPAKSV